jgi:hypothetical protein
MLRNVHVRSIAKLRPKYAFEYIKINKSTFDVNDDILKIISTSAKCSCKYVQFYWVKIKFPMGEPAIATSARYSYKYALYLNEAFPAGEKAILTDPKYTFLYVTLVLGTEFPGAKKMIFSNRRYKKSYMIWLGMDKDEVERRCSDEGMLADYELNK